jgi:hypothetical protein
VEIQASLLHFTGSDVNSIACTRPGNFPQAVDLSGSAVIPLPTITENNRPHLLGSNLSTTYSYPATSSEEASSVTAPSNDRKIFTVTLAEDPMSNV